MVDVDTFLTTLYVMVDDFCHSHPPTLPTKKPGPQASLCASEVITLAIFARWGRFSSERDFYRYARTSRAALFLPCQIAPSSTASCASIPRPLRRWPCTWRGSLRIRRLPTRPLTPRRCPFATRSAADTAGLLDGPTSAGPTAWLVRGVLPFDRRRAFRRDHRLLLWSCL